MASTEIRSLLSKMPAGVGDFLDVEIPTISVPSLPTDEESAILAMGVAAYNECNILKQFEGFTPVEAAMRLGQLNNSAIASILLRIAYDGGSGWNTSESWESNFHVEGDGGSTGMLTNRPKWSSYNTDQLNIYSNAIKAWYVDCGTRIAACETAYASGLVMPYSDTLPIPSPITLPGIPDAVMPPIIFFAVWLIRFISDNNILPIVREVVRRILRRIGSGGDTEPMMKLFKKFAFLEQGDMEQGFPSLTSILLLLADKPIEIINSLGEYDVFLDTVVDREGED